MLTQTTAGNGGGSAAPWCDLPADLLGKVSSMIISPRDRVHFAAVCRPWRAAAKLQPARAMPSLLLVCSFGRYKTEHLCGPGDSWEYHAPSKIADMRFVGSQDGGWMALLDKRTYTIAIMNMFTGAEVALSEKQRKISSICVVAPCPYNIKIIFSGDPTSSDGCILAANIEECLHICKIGCHDGRWTTCRNHKLIDIAFCNGELYGLISSHDGILIKIKIGVEGDCILVLTAIKHLAIERPTWYHLTHFYVDASHIFELHGKLSIAVKARWLPNLHPYFKVFNLVDVDAGEPYKHKWEEVTNFGDYALFLGSTRSKAVHVPAIAEHDILKRNHIYHTIKINRFISNSPQDAVYSVTSGDEIMMYCQKDQNFEDGMERTGYYVTGVNYAMWVHPPDL